jgi:hypothetical protein
MCNNVRKDLLVLLQQILEALSPGEAEAATERDLSNGNKKLKSLELKTLEKTY